MINTKHRNYEEFDIKVGVHQDSILSQLQFLIVLEALRTGKREKVFLGYCYVLMIWF